MLTTVWELQNLGISCQRVNKQYKNLMYLRELNRMNIKERYQFKLLKRFAALEIGHK